MKNLIFGIITLFLMSSCISIYFTEPQPEGGILLTEVPEELHGTWLSENGQIKIDKYGLSEEHINRNTESKEIDSSYNKTLLSDTFRLYKAKDFFILSYKEDNRDWEIIVIQKHTNGDIYLYSNQDPEFFITDKNLKLVNAHYTIDYKDSIVQTLNPDFEESLSFQSATFSGQMQSKTIKKLARKENIMNILKKDGTMYVPDNDSKN